MDRRRLRSGSLLNYPLVQITLLTLIALIVAYPIYERTYISKWSTSSPASYIVIGEDTDGDGLRDRVEICMVCTNPNNPDSDGGGCPDNIEILMNCDPWDSSDDASGMAYYDSDGDWMADDWEQRNGLNPNDPTDANQDPDGDGLSNREEYLFNLDPNNEDTDSDGLYDGWYDANSNGVWDSGERCGEIGDPGQVATRLGIDPSYERVLYRGNIEIVAD